MSEEPSLLGRYDDAAEASAAVVIGRYSTSFGAAARLLERRRGAHPLDLRPRAAWPTRSSTAPPREAGLDDAELRAVLDELEAETESALRRGYSTNLVVHAFAKTAREAGIDKRLTRPFFASMRRDLDPSPFTADESPPTSTARPRWSASCASRCS